MSKLQEVKVKGQRDPEVKLLSTPAVTETGAKLKFMSLWKKDGVEFAHVYVELIEISETIGNLDEVNGQMFLQQLSDRAYNTTEWVELTYEDGTVKKVLAIVCQDAERPGDDAINFMVSLQTQCDTHSWEVLENGSVANHKTGLVYSVTYVNEYTAALGYALEQLKNTMGVPDHIAHYAMLHALPFFKEMYMPDMEAHAIKQRLPGWNQAKKMAVRMAKIAETNCPAPEQLNK